MSETVILDNGERAVPNEGDQVVVTTSGVVILPAKLTLYEVDPGSIQIFEAGYNVD